MPAVSRAVKEVRSWASAHCSLLLSEMLGFSELFIHQSKTWKTIHSKHKPRSSHHYQVSRLCECRQNKAQYSGLCRLFKNCILSQGLCLSVSLTLLLFVGRQTESTESVSCVLIYQSPFVTGDNSGGKTQQNSFYLLTAQTGVVPARLCQLVYVS